MIVACSEICHSKVEQRLESSAANFAITPFQYEEVLSSRYCRTRETAELTFGLVTTWQPLDLLYALPQQDRDARTEIVAQRIGAYVGKGNLIMITHLPNIDALTLELVEPGGFLVLQPDHNGGFDIVGDFSPAGMEIE
jgi:phosphohistidine phosphatase SixA